MTQSQILALLTPVIGFALEGRNQNLASTLQVIQIINDGDKKVSVVLPFCFFFGRGVAAQSPAPDARRLEL